MSDHIEDVSFAHALRNWRLVVSYALAVAVSTVALAVVNVVVTRDRALAILEDRIQTEIEADRRAQVERDEIRRLITERLPPPEARTGP